VAAALARRSRARLLYDLLLPYAERAVVVGFGIACFGRPRARSPRSPSSSTAPPTRWRTSACPRLNARMGARVFLAYTQHEYAAFLAARGAARRPQARGAARRPGAGRQTSSAWYDSHG
jgi:hypothetical protein